MRWITIAAFLCCMTTSTTLAAADELANSLNRKELFRIQGKILTNVGPAKAERRATDDSEIGVLYLRGDGGDPQQVRADDSSLIYITTRTGPGRTYQNGREVEINPAIHETVRQIAMQQFRAPIRTPLLVRELPAMAQAALTRFAAGRSAYTLVFAQTTSREDTARASERRATKITAFGTSSTAERRDIVELVKSAMLVFGLKSDACDKSGDPRCDQPGVREAFAQIKREELAQLTGR